ncbi:retrotransposon protein, putative, ty1-copia subclass [Tanacetum coccineum]
MGFNQFSQQQQPNQSTASQPQSDHQSFNLIDETEDENAEEPIPTPTSKKTSRGARLKAKAKKTKETESQVEIKKRARNVWTQDEELLLTESFIQIFEDPKTPKISYTSKAKKASDSSKESEVAKWQLNHAQRNAYDINSATNRPHRGMIRPKSFTLRYKNKEYVLDEQIPTINDDSTQEEMDAHQKHYDDANKVPCIMAKASKEHLDVVKSLMACKLKPRASICAFVLEIKGYFDSLLQTTEQGIKKIDVPSTSIAHVLTIGHNAKKRKTSHSNWKGRAAKGKFDHGSKRKAESEIAPASIQRKQCLKESRRLKHGELNLVMGNMKITPITRIRKYELMLKSEVRIDLNNSSPCKGIYETTECINNNGNIILIVGSSNELDKSKLWHSRLGHINKKRIAQLQKDGVLESFDLKSDNVCESCLLGKMTKSPFTEDKISDSTLSELDEPANYKEAMASPEAANWKEAMKSKI